MSTRTQEKVFATLGRVEKAVNEAMEIAMARDRHQDDNRHEALNILNSSKQMLVEMKEDLEADNEGKEQTIAQLAVQDGKQKLRMKYIVNEVSALKLHSFAQFLST